MPEKRCVTCQEMRPLEAFNRRAAAPDGHQARCRECCQRWYRHNSTEHKLNVRKRKRTTLRAYRERVIAYFEEHPCVDCGETDIRVLEFDHREGVEKLAEVTLLISAVHSWERVTDEMEKCDVRCANCHRRKTAERANSWRHSWWLTANDAAANRG